MKIGIMGSHGTGKTTFALRMAANLKLGNPGDQIGILSEVARTCPFSINQQASEDAQRWIFHKQFIQELELSAMNETLVCDRTVLDSLAYSERAGYLELVNDFLPIATGWMQTYDEIYFLRPNGDPPAHDGFRDTDRQFQKDIDLILAWYIETYGLTVAQVIIGDKDHGDLISNPE